MSRETHGAGGVRVYVPDADGTAHYHPRNEVVSQLRAHDRGPDVLLEIYVRGLRSGTLTIPAKDEPLLRRRLFVDLPPGSREAVGALLQELEDAASVQQIENVRQIRRRVMAYFDAVWAAATEPRTAPAAPPS